MSMSVDGDTTRGPLMTVLVAAHSDLVSGGRTARPQVITSSFLNSEAVLSFAA